MKLSRINIKTISKPLGLLVFLFFLSIFKPLPSQALTLDSFIGISAAIGQSRVSIYGYTSPNSKVKLSSPRVLAYTTSDQNGYFLFDKTYLPKNPSELCLSTLDLNSLLNKATCFPPPPPQNYHTDLGPFLLSPTISLSASTSTPHSTLFLSGSAPPQTLVTLHLYQIENTPPLLPKPAYALSLPQITTLSDTHGNYSFSLPTTYASNYRFFTTALFDSSPTPPSNTLNYSLPTLLSYYWNQNPTLISLLIIFVITLAFFIYLLFQKAPRWLPLPLSCPLPKKAILK